MNSINPINPITYPGWDNILLSHPDSSFFHSSAWASVLSESYHYAPKYFTIIDNGKLSALIPVMEVTSFLTGKRGVSLPFTDYCNPICNVNIKFADLFNQLIEFGRKQGWKYIELRGGGLDSEITRNSQRLFSEASAQAGATRNSQPGTCNMIPSLTYLGHVINLGENEEEIFYGLKDSARRNIKKANREGVEVKINHSPESVREFYRLNCMTRREHGLPSQPFHFFEKVYDHVISKNLGMVVLASLNQKNVAGAVYFHFGKKAVFKYGASDKRFQHLRANNLVMWEAIKWYSQKGYKSLCLGRTEPENQGLIQFKSGWGTTEQQIQYYRYDLNQNSFVPGGSKGTGFHNTIFKHLPLPMSNKIGALLYKHVG